MCITFAWILDRIMFLRIDLHVRKYFHDDDLQRNPSTTTTTTTTEVFHGVDDDDVDDDDQVENILEHTHTHIEGI